jgi:hypothetical protein
MRDAHNILVAKPESKKPFLKIFVVWNLKPYGPQCVRILDLLQSLQLL